jgi:hypothetical protein
LQVTRVARIMSDRFAAGHRRSTRRPVSSITRGGSFNRIQKILFFEMFVDSHKSLRRAAWHSVAPVAPGGQITNRLCALKTGSAPKNRTIRARMFRAIRKALSAPVTKLTDAKGFRGVFCAAFHAGTRVGIPPKRLVLWGVRAARAPVQGRRWLRWPTPDKGGVP